MGALIKSQELWYIFFERLDMFTCFWCDRLQGLTQQYKNNNMLKIRMRWMDGKGYVTTVQGGASSHRILRDPNAQMLQLKRPNFTEPSICLWLARRVTPSER